MRKENLKATGYTIHRKQIKTS